VLIDGKFAATAASVRLTADILGRQPRGAEIAIYAERTFSTVDNVLARVPADKRPCIYLARGPEGLETGGQGSINTEIIERVGGVNVAEGLGGRGNIGTASLEQIVAWNPDAIVTQDRAFFQAVQGKPGWNELRAVTGKKVYLAPSLPWGWIDSPPSINRLIGLRWLLSTFYPKEASLDLRADAEAFYALFYRVTLSDAQFDRLLGGGPVH
jgi:iron complex transport system substrate-binding protein